MPGLLKIFSKKCVFVYLFSFRTHMSKSLFVNNNCYVINKGHIEPVLNFWAGTLWFKTVNTCPFEIRVKQVYKEAVMSKALPKGLY